MLSGRINDLFPFLNSTAYLGLTTTGQALASPSYDALRRALTVLLYCNRPDTTIRYLRCTALDDERAIERR
ncbi:MAG: hypothetical protein JWM87_2092 [Candidatus Eremiobacteraeota bacterium]|nr:hypothetical protein [Candidatus Eremiobacteraeota bacterium]